jgi:TRAP-type C4-dicarboxylate transport system permease small subunit
MKFVFNILSFLSDTINRFVELLVVSLLLFLSILMVLAVFYRYGLNSSIYWSDEVSKILLVFIAFLGSTVAYKHKAHIGIDILAEKLSKKLKKYLEILIALTFLSFWILILLESLKMMPLFMMQKTATLEIPYAYVFFVVPFSSSIWIVHVLDSIMLNFMDR